VLSVVCAVIFKLLDGNEDGHLDVSELLCAVSIWCSADYSKIHKCECCCKMGVGLGQVWTVV